MGLSYCAVLRVLQLGLSILDSILQHAATGYFVGEIAFGDFKVIQEGCVLIDEVLVLL